MVFFRDSVDFLNFKAKPFTHVKPSLNLTNRLTPLIATDDRLETDFSVQIPPPLYETWRMFRHDRCHTGRFNMRGSTTNDLRWSWIIGKVIRGSPALSDGTVYISADDGLYAFTTEGTFKWMFPLKNRHHWSHSSPAVGERAIYVGDYEGKDGRGCLYAVQPDGSLKWRFIASDWITASPTLDTKETIYFGDWSGKLYALNPDGSVKWILSIRDESFLSSPVLSSDESTIYIGGKSGRFYGIDSRKGRIKWCRSFKTNELTLFGSSPSYDDGVIYVGVSFYRDYKAHLLALNERGRVLWEYELGGERIASSPAVGWDGTIYVSAPYREKAHLYAFRRDGKLIWRVQIDKSGRGSISSPAVDREGVVYVGSYDGYLYAINDGEILWKFRTDGNIVSSPAICCDGTIYFGSDDGRFYAVGGFKRLLTVCNVNRCECCDSDDFDPVMVICSQHVAGSLGLDS